MKTTVIASLAVALWVAGLSPVLSEPPVDRDRMEGRMEKMKAQLSLTPDQEKKLKEHRQAHREERKKMAETMRAKRDALEQEMAKPSFDEAKVKILHSELQVLRTQMADQRLQGILEVRKILTPEQFAKFRAMTQDDWKRRGRDREKFRGPHADKP